MKWIWTSIAILLSLLIIFGIYFYTQFSAHKKAFGIPPILELAQVSVKDIDKDKITMIATLKINNPAPIGFTSDSIRYHIFIDGTEVAEDLYGKKIKIGANSMSSVKLPVEIFQKKIIDALKGAEKAGKDTVEYAIRSTLFLPITGHKGININIKKNLPLFKIPQIELEKIELDKLGLKHTKSTIKLKVINNNVFRLAFKDIHYTFQIDGKELINGDITKIMLPPHGFTITEIPVDMNVGQVISKAFNMVMNKDMKYVVSMKSKIVSDLDMFNNSTIILQKEDVIRKGKFHL